MNSVSIIGNLIKTPSLSSLSGKSGQVPVSDVVCNFAIIHNQRWTDKDTKEKKERASLINITAFRGLANNLCKFMRKGYKISVTGILQTDSWTDDAGKKRHATYVLAKEIDFLTPKPSSNGGQVTVETTIAPEDLEEDDGPDLTGGNPKVYSTDVDGTN